MEELRLVSNGMRRRTRRREGLSTTTLMDAEGKVRLTAPCGGLRLHLVWKGGGGGGGGCECGCGGGPEIERGAQYTTEPAKLRFITRIQGPTSHLKLALLVLHTTQWKNSTSGEAKHRGTQKNTSPTF
ncbi:hypothetical protein PIB30_022591 [Stylosanthes scabra]|uniref:Uncharacterized protein n=1 Tax=Stylosanthes scabra TaxID=79078 RepID=A0ABU6Q9U0_9FABA|nr:hypothetical protein [Stylosanthes scabra]